MFSKLSTTSYNITKGLQWYLQDESLELGKAIRYKTAVIQTMTELCTDSGSEDVFNRAMTLCEANDI